MTSQRKDIVTGTTRPGETTYNPLSKKWINYVKAKRCGEKCALKNTSTKEHFLIDTIITKGDPTGMNTEALIQSLAERSGYTVLKGGKYGGNKGFDHVLMDKDTHSIVIIDSKQLRGNGVQMGKISPGGEGPYNQLSEEWINYVKGKLEKDDPVAIAFKTHNLKIKTLVAGVDRKTQKVVVIPVRIPSIKEIKNVKIKGTQK